ncbi:MAG: hypothetical protein GYB67_12330 [Chloroflexi bacterium]|nr:hypothetical protein [Chloroflexota bacterium]
MMGRKRVKQLRAAAQATENASGSRIDQVVEQIVEAPRLLRIAITLVFAFALTLALTPLVDRLYSENFFSTDTLWLPASVSTGLGVVMYVVGWRLIVGYAGTTPRPHRVILVYMGVGLACLLVNITLVTVGFFDALNG